MRNRAILMVLALSVAASVVSFRPAEAVELNQWVTGLKADLFLTERGEYETNIFGVRHASDDFILRSVPGFTLDYDGSRTRLAVGYRAEVLHFFKHSAQDDTHHIAFGALTVELPRLRIHLRDDFTRTSDPPNTELTGRVESTTNTVTPEIELKVTDRLSIAGNFSWTHSEVPQFDFLDRDEYLYGATLFWAIAPKAQLGVGYNHGSTDFQKTIRTSGVNSSPNRDVSRDQYLVRLRGDLTSKISAGLNAGYEVRNAVAKNQKDSETWIMGGDISYRPVERTRIGLVVNRSFQESSFSPQFNNALFFTTTSSTLVLDHSFSQKLRGNLRATAVENDYPIKQFTTDHPKPDFRTDNVYGWGGGLDYDIQKWLLVGTEYSHTTRDSSFKEFKYADDKITGKITLRF